MCDHLKSKRELLPDDENNIDNMKSKLVNIIKKKIIKKHELEELQECIYLGQALNKRPENGK